MKPLAEIYLGQWATINAMSDDDLSKACAETLEINANNLVRLALIVRAKENRGHDLSGLRSGMLRYLRKIASGELLPEVVLRWSGCPSIINKLAAIPIPEQQECIVSRQLPDKYLRKPARRVAVIDRAIESSITVDKARGQITISGHNVVLTRNDLIVLLRRIGGTEVSFMCSACGAEVGERKPARCGKCGSYSFEACGANAEAA